MSEHLKIERSSNQSRDSKSMRAKSIHCRQAMQLLVFILIMVLCNGCNKSFKKMHGLSQHRNKCSGIQTSSSDFKQMLKKKDLKDQCAAYFKFKDRPKAVTDIRDQINIVLLFYGIMYILN